MMTYDRGTVVRGPDLFANYDFRPYVCVSDETHPFSDEEALYAVVTTTRRAAAVPLTDDDFSAGGLPRESYVNPWTIVSIRHADIQQVEGHLVSETTEKIATDAASYLGVRRASRRRDEQAVKRRFAPRNATLPVYNS